MSLKTQNVSDRAPNGGYAVSICGGPPKFVSEFFFPQFLTGRVAHLCFGLYSHYSPESWQVVNMEYLHFWGWGMQGMGVRRYVLSIEY